MALQGMVSHSIHFIYRFEHPILTTLHNLESQTSCGQLRSNRHDMVDERIRLLWYNTCLGTITSTQLLYSTTALACEWPTWVH